METKRIAGMVWYRLEDYDAALVIMEDRHKLPLTYAQWRMSAEQGEKQMRRAGWATTRAYIDPAQFVAWCNGRGLKVDAEARQLFANEVALQTSANL